VTTVEAVVLNIDGDLLAEKLQAQKRDQSDS
jgi:hypothetical protein